MFEQEKIVVCEVAREAMAKVKNIVVKAAREKKPHFPKKLFGIRDDKKRCGETVEGMLGDVDVTVHAVKSEMPGIVLYDARRFWEENWVVLLTLDGIFKCHFVMSEAKNKRKDNLIDALPDWTNRREDAGLYLQYAERALKELERIA